VGRHVWTPDDDQVDEGLAADRFVLVDLAAESLTGDDLDDQEIGTRPTAVVWRWTDLRKLAVLALPLLLGGSLGVGASLAPAASLQPGGASTVTDPTGGPVGSAAGSPAPDTMVLPVDGDPAQLSPGTAGVGSPVDQSKPAPPAGDTTAVAGLTSTGIPLRTLQAYVAAADTTARTTPGCHLHWSLLAGIGRVESNHGRFAGATVTGSGLVTPSVYGPLLNGQGGLPTITDSDRGRLDGNGSYDRAVGPMQFLPATWVSVAVDADRDGIVEPQDVDDASLAAARYLCLGGTDLASQNGRWSAILRYNHSSSYAALVIALADSYAQGRAVAVPSAPAGVTAPTQIPPATVPAAAPVPVAQPATTTAQPTTGSSAPETIAADSSTTSGDGSASTTSSSATSTTESPSTSSSEPSSASPSPTTPSPTTPTTPSPTGSDPTPSPSPSTPSPTSSEPTPTPSPSQSPAANSPSPSVSDSPAVNSPTVSTSPTAAT
jgi:hypothetical protein